MRIECTAAPPSWRADASGLDGARTLPLTLSVDGGIAFAPFGAAAPRFVYFLPPYVQRLQPAAGPVEGGTTVTLSGLHLNAGG